MIDLLSDKYLLNPAALLSQGRDRRQKVAVTAFALSDIIGSN